MKIQISRISIGQTAKVVGVLHVVLGAPVLLLAIIAIVTHSTRITSVVSPMWLVLAPLMYGLGAYLMAFVMCVIYNFIAKYFGGVEYTTSEKMVGE
jgi:hypothetical protein